MPNYRKFLRSSDKMPFLEIFVSDYLMTARHDLFADAKFLILAGGLANGQMLKVFKESGMSDLPNIFSLMKRLLYAIHYSQEF